MKQYNIGIFVPMAMESVPKKFYDSEKAAVNYLIENTDKLPFPVKNIRFWNPNTFPIDANRNECVAHVFRDDVDFSVWLDADQELRKETIFNLLSKGFNYPIYAGIYYLKREPYYPVIFKDKTGEFKEFTPLFRYPPEPFYADMIGMGCVKINKEVFEKLERPYFKYQAIPPSLNTLSDYVSFKIDNGVEDVSEDVWFWKQVKEKTEYKVVVDPDISVGHITTLSITRTIAESAWQAYREMSEKAREGWETLPIPEKVNG